MAGRPRRAELVKEIAARGGEAALIARIESGETIATIANGLGVSRSQLSAWLNRTPERKERVMRAREAAADALAEEGLRIADGASNQDHQARKLQIDQRRWLASRWNRETYGESPLVSIAVSADQLMLSALQKPLPPRPAQLTAIDDGPRNAKCEDDA